jgi:hypothetical protein
MNNKLKLGDQVDFSAHLDCVFIITAQHDDGSYTIETKPGEGQLLKYEHVVQEMLRRYIAA